MVVALAAGGDGRQGGARPNLLPHAVDLALCRGASDRRYAVAVPVQPVDGDAGGTCCAATAFDWDPLLNGDQAMGLVVAAAAWKQISYNFLFFVAGLQAIPKSLIEAAAIDGAAAAAVSGPSSSRCWRRPRSSCWWSTPSTPSSTRSASSTPSPAAVRQADGDLVYKVYNDGFVNLDLGSRPRSR
jgi:hypothetical protein